MEQYRKTPRARFLDYDYGEYFVTICTKDKTHYFGEIHDNEMHLSEIGKFCYDQFANHHSQNHQIEIMDFTVMPNHVHTIVRIKQDNAPNESTDQRAPNPYLRAHHTCQRHVPTLSRYISSFKGAITKYAKANNVDFALQSRYHDHFIRGTRDGDKIRNYIINNVSNWDNDCFK